MQILAGLPFTALAVLNKGLFQQAEVIGFRTEVADVFTQIARLTDGHVHLRARVAVKAVAFDLRRTEIQLGENLAKCEAGGGGSRTTRPRNGNNRMSGRHSNSLTEKGGRSAVKRVAGHDIHRLMQF